jgi:uncharacterized protein involved in exopolysaccharide biosynthesis
MENQQNYTKYEEELEIDLMDYIRIIWRRKISILIILVLVIIVALILTFTLPKTYKSSLMVRSGRIQNMEIENLKAIIQVFNQETVLGEVAKKMGLKEDEIKLAKSRFKLIEANGLLEIDGFGRSPDKAFETTQIVWNVLSDHHSLLFKATKEAQEQQITDLKNTVGSLNKEISDYEGQIKMIIRTQSEAQGRIAAALISNIETKKSQKKSYEQLLLQKQQELVSQTFETKVEVPATTPIRPVKPNKIINMIAGIILGLFIGVFYAFAAEYWQKK